MCSCFIPSCSFLDLNIRFGAVNLTFFAVPSFAFVFVFMVQMFAFFILIATSSLGFYVFHICIVYPCQKSKREWQQRSKVVMPMMVHLRPLLLLLLLQRRRRRDVPRRNSPRPFQHQHQHQQQHQQQRGILS